MQADQKEFLRSGPDLSTPRPVRQTTIVTLQVQGRDLAVAELISVMRRGVVEVGELNAIDRLVELEVEGVLAAMEKEDVWSCPITKAARKAEKKAELELYEALESLDLRDARECPKRLPRRRRKERQSPRKPSPVIKLLSSLRRKGGEETPNKSQNKKSSPQT